MPEEEKSLEMRVSELEDKLERVTVSEEDLEAAQRVLGAAPGAAPAGPCIIHQCIIHQCIISQCIIHQCIISQCIIRNCIIQQCFECSCGPCNLPGGGGGISRAGGGFGSLGM
jgi:hypothetical protein